MANDTGNFARQAAAVPTRRNNTPAVPKVDGTAGLTLQDALKAATDPEEFKDMAIESSKIAAAAAAEAAGKGRNPLLDLFTAISFDLPNDKPYVNKKNPNIVTRPAANVTFHTAVGLTFYASIKTIEETFDDGANGQFVKCRSELYWPTRGNFDRTPSVTAAADRPETGMQLARYIDHVLDLFMDWEETATRKAALPDVSNVPRHVKIKRIAPVVAAPAA